MSYADVAERNLGHERSEFFRVLLGPSHPDHEDHLHFDMSPWTYSHLECRPVIGRRRKGRAGRAATTQACTLGGKGAEFDGSTLGHPLQAVHQVSMSARPRTFLTLTAPAILALALLTFPGCGPVGSGPSGTGGGPLGTGGAAPGTGGGFATGGGVGHTGGASAGGAGTGGVTGSTGGVTGSTGGTLGVGGSTGGGVGTGGTPATSAVLEDTGLDCTISEPTGPNGASATTLPDPFTKWDGTQVANMSDWRCRRRELVVEVEKRILGPKAPPPSEIGGSVSGTVSGSGYSVEITNPGGSSSFSGTVSLPSSGSAPYPAVIVVGNFNSLNPDVLSSEGVATMSYDAYGIASESSGNFSSGKYFDANPDFEGKTGALVAWAWGVSRIIDMLEQNPDVIDPTKIAIHGCSRFGKAAFVIGAFDQRIALGLPLEPGTGGPAPLRALPSLGGQTLSSANGEASWFGPNSGSYSSSMAADMSDVATMYAPRGFLLMDNPHIDHLAYKANFLGAAAAAKVYDAMGSDGLWYLGSSNDGGHCGVRAEYGAPLRAMIQKFLKGDQSPTTGGLDTHANHGNIDVDGWTSSWTEGPIAP